MMNQISSHSSRPVIELSIDEVVLHGFRPRDRHAIGDALERELTRLLSRPGALAAIAESRDIPRVDAGQVSLQQGSPAPAIGKHLARAIHKELLI
jgi:hypothetical protein